MHEENQANPKDAITVIRILCEKCIADCHEDCNGKTEAGDSCECEVRHPLRSKAKGRKDAPKR